MFVTYWGGMAGIIWFDGQRQRAKASVVGNVDFIDRRPGAYMILGAFCGPLPLIFYFGTTRRSVTGWLVGIGIGFGWSLVVSTIFKVGIHAITHR